MQDYLQGNPVWLQYVKYPLASLGYESKYDVIVRAEGGGLSAQARAILLGIARALIVANQANRDPLKKQGFSLEIYEKWRGRNMVCIKHGRPLNTLNVEFLNKPW